MSLTELEDSELPFADLLNLSTLTLATVGVEGQPHSAPVYFVAGEGLHLYFFSDSQSQHSQDIQHDPRAALSIYPECWGWEEIHGVQMRGEVHRLERGQEWDLAWEQYQTKFPFVAGLKEIVAQNSFYRFVPNWVRLVDNRKGFGYKQEWEAA
jgi:uncharacterized protein YhbP (UPF0306 family)